jgi:tetratricopeptide (TPR) repeat protein
MLMLHASSRTLVKAPTEDIIAIYNQLVAMYPWFVPALTGKAVLLCRLGDWEQSLDSAQRGLDADNNNYDALTLIAVHAFTQESQPHDALQKLEDVQRCLTDKEPDSVNLAIESAQLFSRICAKQPRALQLCVKMLERVTDRTQSDEEQAHLLCSLGHIYLMQGILAYESAMKSFKEASKLDPNNVPALEGMIFTQLSEGMFDDAEGQIELLAVMHNADELSPEFYYLKAMLAKHHQGVNTHGDAQQGQAPEHLLCLDDCRNRFFARAACSQETSPFGYLTDLNADFLLKLAVDYMDYTDSGSVSVNLFAKPEEANAAEDEEQEDRSASIISGMAGAGMTIVGGATMMNTASPTRLTKGGNKPAAHSSNSDTGAQQQVLEMPPLCLWGSTS